MSFEDDFLRGQRDCKETGVAKPNQGEAYDRGFGTQYEREQIESEMISYGLK